MAEEPRVTISDALDGEVNGLSVRNVRSLTAMFSDIVVKCMKSGVVRPEEVASAIATVAACTVTVTYVDIKDAQALLQAAVDMLPGRYAQLEAEMSDEKEARPAYYIMRGPSTPQ